MTKEDLTAKYFTQNQMDTNVLPAAKTWAFVALPKRGKTSGIARFNRSGDMSKTIFLDFENCVLHYPQFKGLNVMNINSYSTPKRPVLDDNGKTVLVDGKPKMESVPLLERGFHVNGIDTPVYSVMEVLAILNAIDQQGGLKDYESIAVDTVDILQSLVEEHVIQEYNTKEKTNCLSIGDIGEYGSGWDQSKKIVIGVILELKKLCEKNNLELCLSIHSKTTTQIKGKTQRDPALRAGTTLSLFGHCAAIAYVDREYTDKKDGDDDGTVYKGQQYTISFMSSSEELTGGTRFQKLVGETVPFSYKLVKQKYEE